MEEHNNVLMAREVARLVAQAGGRTFYVGGFVRDRLLKRENKDVDIEVHGIGPRELSSLLDTLGERMEVGESFGIMGLRHYDLDIALPRSEKATGRGHRDFEVSVDPYIGPERAARRRDFTINALMEDVLTGEVLDFFGGQDDLARGVIRHVDDRSFGEDPLRVLRAAQFAARFGFSVAPATRELCARMDLSALPGERVWGELQKALLKADKPSVFFRELDAMGQLGLWFGELVALKGVPQPPAHHPEGDAWTHTLQVVDVAADLRDTAQNTTGLLMAALCHDMGKAVCTEVVNGVPHAYGHEQDGLPRAQAFVGRLTREVRLRRYVLNMVKLHMRPNMLVGVRAKRKSFMHLFDESVCPEDLLLLAKADHLGRRAPDGSHFPEPYAPIEARLALELAEYRRRMALPLLSGNDLIAAGFTPGPAFKEALDLAHKLQLAGRPWEEQLKSAAAVLRKAR